MGKIQVLILRDGYDLPSCFQSDPESYSVKGTVNISLHGEHGSIDEIEFAQQVNTFIGRDWTRVFGLFVRCVSALGVAERNWGDPKVIVISITGKYRTSINLPAIIRRKCLPKRFLATKDGYGCLCAVKADDFDTEDAKALYESGVDILLNQEFDWKRLPRELRERHCLVHRLWEWHIASIIWDVCAAVVGFFLFGVFQKLGERIVGDLFNSSIYLGYGVFGAIAALGLLWLFWRIRK